MGIEGRHTVLVHGAKEGLARSRDLDGNVVLLQPAANASVRPREVRSSLAGNLVVVLVECRLELWITVMGQPTYLTR